MQSASLRFTTAPQKQAALRQQGRRNDCSGGLSEWLHFCRGKGWSSCSQTCSSVARLEGGRQGSPSTSPKPTLAAQGEQPPPLPPPAPTRATATTSSANSIPISHPITSRASQDGGKPSAAAGREQLQAVTLECCCLQSCRVLCGSQTPTGSGGARQVDAGGLCSSLAPGKGREGGNVHRRFAGPKYSTNTSFSYPSVSLWLSANTPGALGWRFRTFWWLYKGIGHLRHSTDRLGTVKKT